MHGNSAHNKGLIAEKVARVYLLCCGYKIVASRLKIAHAEIDIVTKKGKRYYIFEVKYRKLFCDAMDAIASVSAERIYRAFAFYADINHLECDEIMVRGIALARQFPFLRVVSELKYK